MMDEWQKEICMPFTEGQCQCHALKEAFCIKKNSTLCLFSQELHIYSFLAYSCFRVYNVVIYGLSSNNHALWYTVAKVWVCCLAY